jgi:5'-3' exonuclease
MTISTNPNAELLSAQCASLAREGAVYAAGSEDMDTLTFGGSILYRHLTFSEAKKAPIMEVNLEKALEGLDMDMSRVCNLIAAFNSRPLSTSSFFVRFVFII